MTYIPTKIDKKVAQLALEGESQRTIADQLGVSKTQVQRRLSRPEVRAIIQGASSRLASECVDRAVSNLSACQTEAGAQLQAMSYARHHGNLRLARKISSEARHIVKQGMEASAQILKATGLLPSGSAAPSYQQVYVDARGSTLSPQVAQLLGLARGAGEGSALLGMADDSSESGTGSPRACIPAGGAGQDDGGPDVVDAIWSEVAGEPGEGEG